MGRLQTCLLLLSLLHAVCAVDRFVSSTGSDDVGNNVCVDRSAPCATVQQALSISAAKGDRVVLLPGVLTLAATIVVPETKTIVIRGETDVAGLYVIQCSASINSAFFIEGTPSLQLNTTATLEYLHITGCSTAAAPGGGAVLIHNASPVLQHLHLTHNHIRVGGAGIDGGAIHVYGDSITEVARPKLYHLTIHGCYANADQDGGGLYISRYAQPDVQHCVFTGNQAFLGGAIAVEAGIALPGAHRQDLRFENVTIERNYATLSSGALNAHHAGDITFVDSVISNNAARASGAIYLAGDVNSISFIRCQVNDNVSAFTEGGAITVNGQNYISAVNSTFLRNHMLYYDSFPNAGTLHCGAGTPIGQWSGNVIASSWTDQAGAKHFSSCGEFDCPACFLPNVCVDNTCITPCAPGQGRPAAEPMAACFACPPGTIGTGYETGDWRCIDCPPGTLTPGSSTGNALCQACPVGTYSSDPGTSGACTPCPAGRSTSGLGAMAVDQCIVATCGDGVLAADEQCDSMVPSSIPNGSVCTADCVLVQAIPPGQRIAEIAIASGLSALVGAGLVGAVLLTDRGRLRDRPDTMHHIISNGQTPRGSAFSNASGTSAGSQDTPRHGKRVDVIPIRKMMESADVERLTSMVTTDSVMAPTIPDLPERSTMITAASGLARGASTDTMKAEAEDPDSRASRMTGVTALTRGVSSDGISVVPVVTSAAAAAQPDASTPPAQATQPARRRSSSSHGKLRKSSDPGKA